MRKKKFRDKSKKKNFNDSSDEAVIPESDHKDDFIHGTQSSFSYIFVSFRSFYDKREIQRENK